MKKLSTTLLVSCLIGWGVYFYLKNNRSNPYSNQVSIQLKKTTKSGIVPQQVETLLSENKRRKLDQIGSVINVKNVVLDKETINKIRIDKIKYEKRIDVKELQAMLEQSYSDPNSSIKDIKRIQEKIIESKIKMKATVENTERWDPRFVYYLMLQESYTYSEINLIKSLSENGLNHEEVEYINELIVKGAFTARIMAYKSQKTTDRSFASIGKNQVKPKEVDDFINDPLNDESITESNLIEMNYNQEEE